VRGWMILLMADFSDDFTETGSDVGLRNHTPDTGTGWAWVGTNDDGYRVNATPDQVNIGVIGGETAGAGYDEIDPVLGDADQQIWFRAKSLGNLTNVLACIRLVDEDNLYGWYLGGGGSAGRRLAHIITGTLDDLITSQGVDEEWIRIKAEGNTLTMWQGGTGSEPSDPLEDSSWTQVENDIPDQTDHNTETTCGLANRTALSTNVAFIDTFRANTVGAAPAVALPSVSMAPYQPT